MRYGLFRLREGGRRNRLSSRKDENVPRYKRIRRITGYGCDGAVVIKRDIHLDPPDCYTEPSTDVVISWVDAYAGVEKVVETTHAVYPAESNVMN